MPPLALTPNEFLLALVRGVFVASVLSSFGSSLFLYALRRSCGGEVTLERRCRSRSGAADWCGGVLAALAVALAWLFWRPERLPTPNPARDWSWERLPCCSKTHSDRSFPIKFWRFLLRRSRRCRTGSWPLVRGSFHLRGVLSKSGHGHAFAMSQGVSALLLSQALHLVAAGAWLGALLPLLIVVRDAPLDAAALTVRRFSSLGTVAVTVLAATAMFQGWVLGGGVARTLGTAYGWVLLIKAALFIALIGLAAFNRFRATPALATARAENAKLALQRSIAVETVIGLSIVLAASLLSGARAWNARRRNLAIKCSAATPNQKWIGRRPRPASLNQAMLGFSGRPDPSRPAPAASRSRRHRRTNVRPTSGHGRRARHCHASGGCSSGGCSSAYCSISVAVTTFQWPWPPCIRAWPPWWPP